MFGTFTRALPFFLFATTIAASACISPEVQTIEIADHKEPCVGVGVGTCMIVDGDFFYDGIADFTYAWGYTYVLEVEVTPVLNPMADGSSTSYALIEETSKTRVAEGTTFVFPVVDETLIEHDVDGDIYNLFDGPVVDCATNALCAELASGLPIDDGCIDLTLAHPAEEGAPLVLTAITPSNDDRCGTL